MAILSNFQSSAQEAINVAPPTQSGTLTYTCSSQSPTWTSYPEQVITITNTAPLVSKPVELFYCLN